MYNGHLCLTCKYKTHIIPLLSAYLKGEMSVRGKKLLSLLAIGFLTMVPLAGCGQTTDSSSEGSAEIKIGMITPLTGTVATFGQSTKEAAELAAKQINENGGINGAKIVFVIEDDQGKPDDAANAAQKLINQDQVVAIIGSLTSSCTLAAGPIAQSAGVPMISSSSTADKVAEIGDYVSRVCFKDSDQGGGSAAFAIKSLNAKKGAVLYDVANDYSKGLAETFKAKFTELGGDLVAYESYSTGDSDFNGQLTKIKATSPEVLLLPDYYNTVGLIAKQAKQQGVDAVLLGSDGWDSPELFSIGGDAVNGGYFTNHYSPDNPTPETKAFIEAYKAEYNGKTPDALAALGYDAANVLFDAIKRAGSTDKAAIKDAINSTTEFKGATGTISLDANRNVIKSMVIIKIENGKQVFYESVNPGE